MDNLLKFKKFIKINFKNENLLKSALTHKSADQNNNNEKSSLPNEENIPSNDLDDEIPF